MDPMEMKNAIDSLRSKFTKECNVDMFDPRDVEIMKNSDIPAISFIETTNSLEKAFEGLKKHAIWRLRDSINDLKASHFPVEVFRLGWIYYAGSDLSGRPVMWMKLKVPLGPKPLLYKYFTFTMEQIRNRTLSDKMKPVIVYDCRDPSIDITALKDLVNLGINQYPAWIEYIVFLEMSATFAFFFRAFRYFFPKHVRNRIEFLSIMELETRISRDNYPDYLGGKVTTIDSSILQQCPTFTEYAKIHKLNESEIKSIESYFKENIDTNSNNNNQVDS